MLSSPEIKLLAVSPPCERTEGPRPQVATRLAWGSCRGPRTRRTSSRVPQQPERPAALPPPSRRRTELPNPKTPGRCGRVGPRWSEARRSGGIAGRAQEPGETGWQESESFVVPWKPGNSLREDPAEGREGRVTEPLSGHRARTPSLSTLFTKRQRIAERSVKPWLDEPYALVGQVRICGRPRGQPLGRPGGYNDR